MGNVTRTWAVITRKNKIARTSLGLKIFSSKKEAKENAETWNRMFSKGSAEFRAVPVEIKILEQKMVRAKKLATVVRGRKNSVIEILNFLDAHSNNVKVAR